MAATESVKTNVMAKVRLRQFNDAVERGVAQWKHGRREEALSSFRRAIYFKDDDPKVYAMVADIYEEMCDASTAIVYMRKVLILHPNHVLYKRKMAALMDLKGMLCMDSPVRQIDQAIESFEYALELNSVEPTYWLHLGIAFTKKGDTKRALIAIKRYCYLFPNDADSHILRAKLLWKMGDPASRMEGFRALKEARRLDASHPEVKFFEDIMKMAQHSCLDRANRMFHSGDIKGALEETSTVHVSQLDLGAHLLRARCFRKLGELSNASDELERASNKTTDDDSLKIALERERDVVINDKAMCALRRDESSTAIRLLETVVRRQREREGQADGRFVQNLGDAYLKHGDLDDALRCFTDAQTLSLSLSDEANKVIGEDLGETQGEQKDEFQKSLRTRLALVHNDMGTRHFNRRRFDEAIESFNRAIRHDSLRFADFYVNRGCAKFEKSQGRDIDTSVLDWKRALKIDPNHKLAKIRLSGFA